jgi:hypothetical protein
MNIMPEVNSVYTDPTQTLHLNFFHGKTAPSGPGHPRYRGFTITLTYVTLGETPLA